MNTIDLALRQYPAAGDATSLDGTFFLDGEGDGVFNEDRLYEAFGVDSDPHQLQDLNAILSFLGVDGEQEADIQ